MLNVLLLGDSIRLSYREYVANKLAHRARIDGPEENCRFAAYTLFCLHNWITRDRYDTIQWNNGQWDTCHMLDGRPHTDIDRYVELQKRIAGILQSRCDRLIFATTTPIAGDMWAGTNPIPRSNQQVSDYNAAASEALSPMGVEILDLYTPVFERMSECISEDMVHLTEMGVQVAGDVVAANLAR